MRYIRRILFITTGLDNYLKIIRKAYFIIFKAGLLKKNPVYHWHYFVKNIIRKGDIIIDIGANMGYYSYLFSELTGNSGKVYSVEPVSPLLNQLTKQVKKRKNVTILPWALGDENKDHVSLSVPDGFRKGGYLRHGLFSVQDQEEPRDGEFIFGAIQRKASEVFDALCRIDYIKCDVEGYEKVILDDMKYLLIRHQPIVQVEIRHENFISIVSLFERLGYRAFKLDGKRLLILETLPSLQQQCFDTLFVPPRHFVRIRPFVNCIDTRSMKPLLLS